MSSKTLKVPKNSEIGVSSKKFELKFYNYETNRKIKFCYYNGTGKLVGVLNIYHKKSFTCKKLVSLKIIVNRLLSKQYYLIY